MDPDSGVMPLRRASSSLATALAQPAGTCTNRAWTPIPAAAIAAGIAQSYFGVTENCRRGFG